MARSMSGNAKGALTHLPTAMGWNRRQGGSQDSSGCGGCLVALLVMVIAGVIIEFWVPIVSALGAALLVFTVFKLVALARAKSDSRSTEREASASLAPLQGAESPPAAWYPDPLGEHHYRYWDGSQWCDQVADDARITSHPL